MRRLDLSKIEDCRFYLENLELEFEGGEKRKVLELQLDDGRTVKMNDLSDSEAIQYANDLYESALSLNPGLRYHFSDVLFAEGSYRYVAFDTDSMSGSSKTHYIQIGVGFKF